MSALHFGNALSNSQQGQLLAALYPHSLNYSLFGGRMVSFDGQDETLRVADLVAGGQCVLLVGTLASTKFDLPPSLTYRAVAVEGSQGIYRLIQKVASAESATLPSGPRLQNRRLVNRRLRAARSVILAKRLMEPRTANFSTAQLATPRLKKLLGGRWI